MVSEGSSDWCPVSGARAQRLVRSCCWDCGRFQKTMFRPKTTKKQLKKLRTNLGNQSKGRGRVGRLRKIKSGRLTIFVQASAWLFSYNVLKKPKVRQTARCAVVTAGKGLSLRLFVGLWLGSLLRFFRLGLWLYLAFGAGFRRVGRSLSGFCSFSRLGFGLFCAGAF